MTDEPDDVTRTRLAYDTVAEDYAALLREELAGKPLDRALLTAFAEEVAAAGGGTVADLGCGPGRVAGFLAALGVDVVGVDLSPRMVEVARREHPGIPFAVASMAALPFADASLGGALAWYSIIHTPAARQPQLFTEFARVVRASGPILLAFQVGSEVVHLSHAYGHDIDLETRRQEPARVRALLEEAGFEVIAETLRQAIAPEKSGQGYVLGRRRYECRAAGRPGEFRANCGHI